MAHMRYCGGCPRYPASNSSSRLVAGVLTGAMAMSSPLLAANASGNADLGNLSLEQLANLTITSVSRHKEKLADAAASVYVITADDIRRSGVTSIAEALRLAPGVEVSRTGAHSWSVSIRGFNSNLSNKLLVLIDGRSVYSPLYAGVFWDVQDTLLEDIDRIEVISGPGGTLWGANAVNGVINIITRNSRDTLGGYADVGGGNEEQGFGGFRYGARIGRDATMRAYVKYFNRDSSRNAAGEDAHDSWSMGQGGFRVDWLPTQSDRLTVEGDVYQGGEHGLFNSSFTLGTLPGPSVAGTSDVFGGNLLGHWSRQLNGGGDLKLKVYYDHTYREIPGLYTERRDTFDLDFQHHFWFARRNDVVWGAAFRVTGDHLNNSQYAAFLPDSRTDKTYSAFLQDKIDLWAERLYFTLGSKFEHNDYTGFEFQPNARFTWLVSEHQTFWAAVSRAVRIPARLDADLTLTVPVRGFVIPIYAIVKGSHQFKSEQLIAYEGGYRAQPLDNVSFDVSLYYNQYDRLEAQELGTPQLVVNPPAIYFVLPNVLTNGMKGESYGATVVTDWRPVPRWRLEFQYAYFNLQLHNRAGHQGSGVFNVEGNSPKNQFAVYSYLDLPHQLSLFTGIRHVDNLPNLGIPSYTAVDASLQWRPVDALQFALTGRNLIDRRHVEFGSGGAGNLIERSVYGTVTWRF